MTYLHALQEVSPDMRMATYGTSWEGRDLPVAIFSRPMVAQPWEAIRSGKPIVVLQTNVHGGERTQRESLLIVMREMATPGTRLNNWLDHLIVLCMPQINPDGAEVREGRGQRGNSWGIDLNRDYIKLEQPEIEQLVTNIYHRWYPHMIIDGHNGGAQPYNMNYIQTANASVAQELRDLCDHEIFPLIKRRNEENGFKAWYYARGNAEFWRGAPHEPRIGMTYAGFINSIGITLESPSQSMSDGIQSGAVTFRAILEYAVQQADKLIGTVEQARQETVRMGQKPGGPVMVDMRQIDHDYTVSYEIRDPDNRDQFITVTNGRLRTKPEVLKARARPHAYILPREAVQAVELLRKHNITVEVLREPATLELEAYTIADVRYGNVYNHPASVQIEVGEVITVEQTLPVGTFIVPTAQVMGRLVTHLLEPETDDNVFLWNRMDPWIPMARLQAQRERAAQADPPPGAGGPPTGTQRQAGAGAQMPAGMQRPGAREAGPPLVPIFKLMTPTALPTYLWQGPGH